MTIKMELDKSQYLTIETPFGTVIVAYFETAGLSVATYTDTEHNPVSAVHVLPDGYAIQIHTPEDDV